MKTLYLEAETDVLFEISPEDELRFENLEEEEFKRALQEEVSSEIIFEPLHLYREPIDGMMEIHVEDTLYTLPIIYIVVIRYSEVHPNGKITSNLWQMEDFYKSRREAVERKKKILNGEVNGPWNFPCNYMEQVQVVALNVED